MLVSFYNVCLFLTFFLQMSTGEQRSDEVQPLHSKKVLIFTVYTSHRHRLYRRLF